MLSVCVCVHREKIMALADNGCYIAIHFPDDNPPGWSWGKTVQSLRGAGKDNFWLNFTAEGEPYEKSDDIIIMPAALTQSNYRKTWALVAEKDTPFYPGEHNEDVEV